MPSFTKHIFFITSGNLPRFFLYQYHIILLGHKVIFLLARLLKRLQMDFIKLLEEYRENI